MHRRWVGSVLSFLLPGAGIFLTGDRKAGLKWFFTLTALWFLAALLAPWQTIPNLLAYGSLAVVTLTLGGCMLVRSFRPVPKLGWRRWLLVLILAWVFSSLVPAVSRIFTHPFLVPVSSMEPTINRGDHLFVQKYAYWFADPKRGDIVVFQTDGIDNPRLPRGQFYVKRVAALPGEELEIIEGRLVVGGKPVESPGMLAVSSFTPHLLDSTESGKYRYFVPEGSYFVVGDNATNSFDSRYFGSVPRDSIIGKATKRYWPLQRLGDLR